MDREKQVNLAGLVAQKILEQKPSALLSVVYNDPRMADGSLTFICRSSQRSISCQVTRRSIAFSRDFDLFSTEIAEEILASIDRLPTGETSTFQAV